MRDCWKTARLDGLLLWPYKKAILLALLLPIAFAAINRSLLTGVSFAMCFAAMTTGYPFFLAEKNRMERLYAILPVRKSAVVAGRYIWVLLLGAVALGISLAGPAAGAEDPWGKGCRGGRCRRGRRWGVAVCAVYRVPAAWVLQIWFSSGPDIHVHSRGRLSGDPAFAFAGAAVSLFFAQTVGGSPAPFVALALALVAGMYAASLACSIQVVKNKAL